MTTPTVSFVIPVHNGAAYLGEAIASALAQTVPPLEVIVVDDGSTDGSAEVAAAFGAPVRCLQRIQSGQGAARNHGVQAARGDLIAFLDADDLAHPERLEQQLACFAARPQLAYCDAYTRNFWSPEIAEADRNVHPREGFTHGEALKPRLIITWLVRRELFQQLGGFGDRTFGEDSEWRDRVDDSGVLTHTLEVVLAERRLHHNNLTRRNYDEYPKVIVRDTKERVARLAAENRSRRAP